MSASDLRFLSSPLPVGDDPSMDGADPEFQAICDLANAGRLAEASERIEPLVARGVHDLRLVVVLFVRRFQEGGFVGLAEAIDAILALTGPNLEAFGPFQRRDAQLDKRLAWTFERIAELHAYHAAKKDPTFASWDVGATPEVLAAAIEAGKTLSARLGERGYQEAGQRFGAVSRLLAERADRLRSELPSAAPRPVVVDAAPPSSAPATPEPSPSGRRGVTLQVTERFLDLQGRLAAFSSLDAQGDYERAAIVAEEITAELGDFDPRKYFPELFADFYRHMSRDVEKLSPYLDRSGSPRHEMLRQLLRVDLSRFLEKE